MNLKKILFPLALFSLFVLFLPLTSGAALNITSNKKINVLTSFYPIHIMALNILDNIPQVKLKIMTNSQEGCLHDYSLTPKDVKNLAKSDLFIINGLGMEPFVHKVAQRYPNLKTIIATRGITPLKSNTQHESDHKKHKHNHTHSHNEEFNPHTWVSITLAIKQVQIITEDLARLLPEFSLKINENSKNYVEKLEALKTKMHKTLKTVKNRNIITFHEAFPYFAKEFNLNIVATIQKEPGSDPSAKELSETIEKIKTFNVKALFAEPQYSSKSANTLAKETSAQVYYLDPAATGPVNKNAYIEIMEKNLSVLTKALN